MLLIYIANGLTNQMQVIVKIADVHFIGAVVADGMEIGIFAKIVEAENIKTKNAKE